VCSCAHAHLAAAKHGDANQAGLQDFVQKHVWGRAKTRTCCASDAAAASAPVTCASAAAAAAAVFAAHTPPDCYCSTTFCRPILPLSAATKFKKERFFFWHLAVFGQVAGVGAEEKFLGPCVTTTVNDAAADKIRKYRADYNNNPPWLQA